VDEPLQDFESPYSRLRQSQVREHRIDSALQIAIAVLTITAAYLIATTGPWQRWGFVVGLISQPFWFAAAWRARQFGVLLVAVFYTGAWVQGIYLRFF